MNKLNLGMLESTIQLKSGIQNIMKTASLKVGVKEICESYLKRLENGESEEMLYESFISDMSKFGSVESINKELNLMDFRANQEKTNLGIKRALYEMKNSEDAVIANMIESAVTNYLISKNDESIKNLRETAEIFKGRSGVDKILEAVTYDEYNKKITGKVSLLKLQEGSVKEETLYTQAQIDDIVKQKVDEALKNEREANTPKVKSMSQLEDRLQLSNTIDTLIAKEGRNQNLKSFCESYKNAINSGKSEYTLYESFISGLSQFSYLSAVDTELSAMNDRISKYKQEIDLRKILEMMLQTESYYIVPLIEECVAGYCDNKNATTRMMLRQACGNFEYDPFVKDIMRIVANDRSIENLYLGESVENNKYSHTEEVFSPVLYIKENESVFNVDGVYYSKKGSNISRVPKSDVVKLDESFRRTAEALNESNVEYDEVNDGFRIYSKNGKDSAIVNESGITVNGNKLALETLNNENFMLVENYNGNGDFYKTIRVIRENFGTIAKLDFVKRVKLNESNKAVDVFKVGKTLCMALINESGTTEFYKDVNPIKCKDLMNEHMNFNVDAMFEEVMPNQKKLQEDIDETKTAYEAYIAELEKRKKELQSLKEADDDIDKEELAKAEDLIDKEIAAAKDDYLKYQKDADAELGKNAKSDDGEGSKEGDDATSGDGEGEKKDGEDITDVKGDVEGEVTEPISNTGDNVLDNPETNGDETLNQIKDMSADATEFDALLDTPADSSELERGFDVVKVSFDKNIKSGITTPSGTVIMTVPMVNQNGDIKDEIKMIRFTVGEDKQPVINNDYMSAVMYNAIRSAILASPDLDSVDFNVAATTSAEGEDTASSVTIDSTEVSPELPAEPAEGTPVVAEPSETVIPSEPTDVPPTEVDANAIASDGGEAEIGDKSEITDPISSLNPDASVDGSDVATPAEPAEPQSPAEIESTSIYRGKEEGYIHTSFPIKIGIAYEDILPIEGGKFLEDLVKSKIDCKEETDPALGGDGKGVVLTLKNRAEIEFILNYFKKWLEIDRESFFKGFPELRQFESFNYKKADKLYESLVTEGTIEINIDNSDDAFIDALKSEDIKFQDDEGLTIVANNADEFDKICGFLASYKEDIEEGELFDELTTIVGDLSTDEALVSLPYDGKLISNLDKEGIEYTEDGEDVNIVVTSPEEADVVLSVADELELSSPSLDELSDLIKDGGFVTEGLKITVEDTENHKKITFDADDLDANGEKKEGEDEGENKDGDGDATFGDDNQLYNTKEEAENAKKEEGEDNQQAAQESEKPKKKKFVFKAKKVHESAQPKLAEPHVGDKVYYKNQIGQVTDKNMDGTLTVLVKGSTIICNPSEVKAVTPKVDLVKDPNDEIITQVK